MEHPLKTGKGNGAKGVFRCPALENARHWSFLETKPLGWGNADISQNRLTLSPVLT
jgi:hypothetical protein